MEARRALGRSWWALAKDNCSKRCWSGEEEGVGGLAVVVAVAVEAKEEEEGGREGRNGRW